MNRLYIVLVLALSPFLASCASDDGPKDGIQTGKETQVPTISGNDAKWVYYSLEKNKQVGESAFGDSIADREWASRLDWDIAVSGDLIKTNGGMSGPGVGGIMEVSGNYDSYTFPPDSGYVSDTYE